MTDPHTTKKTPEPVVGTDRRGLLVDQLADAVDAGCRRLDGVSDEEFVWEATGSNWSIRPRNEATTADAFGPGDYVLDLDRSIPVFAPAPLTTMAWRIGHLCSLYAGRWEYTFGNASGDPLDLVEFDVDASTMLDRLWFEIQRWTDNVEDLADDELDAIGRSSYPLGLDSRLPFIAILRWQNSETIHHLAEVALLRDLYAHQS